MYKALDIAFWFIAKNDLDQRDCDIDEYEGITNMKIQKLLYFAQGVSYSLFNKKLFEEDLLAWQHGPVIREVYTEFAKFGSSFIDLDKVMSFNSEVIADIEKDMPTRDVLTDVYDCMNGFSAHKLRSISHDKNGPWAKVYEQGRTNKVIELDKFFVDYFSSRFEKNQ